MAVERFDDSLNCVHGVTCFFAAEFCQLESFRANCSNKPETEVSVVLSARYGRMKVGRCVSRDYGHVGCAIDVLTEVDAMCSGRLDNSCAFPVARLHSVVRTEVSDNRDESMAEVLQCPGDLTSYLEASYSCIPGNTQVYGITQYYLPPDRGDVPAITPAGTRFIDPGGMDERLS